MDREHMLAEIEARRDARKAEIEANRLANRPPLPGLDFLKRLTIEEYATIIAAANANPQLSLWIDMLRVNGEIRLHGPEAVAAKAALVAAGLLTQERAVAIFA